jgi:hypothetical protein
MAITPCRAREVLNEFYTAVIRILADTDKSIMDRFVPDDTTPFEDGEGGITTARDHAADDLCDIAADRDWQMQREWRRLKDALR